MINWIFVASEAVDTLLENNNYVGAIILIFTETMGATMFYGLIFLGLSTALYIRYQSIIPITILAILLFAAFRPVIPTSSMGGILLLMSLAVGILLYQVFIRRGNR